MNEKHKRQEQRRYDEQRGTAVPTKVWGAVVVICQVVFAPAGERVLQAAIARVYQVIAVRAGED